MRLRQIMLFCFGTCLKQNEHRSRAERKVTDTVWPGGRIDRNIAQWNCEKIGFAKPKYCYSDERFFFGGGMVFEFSILG